MKSGSNEKVAAQQDNFPKKTQVYYVNFEGNFGRHHITPRGLRADLLNQFVAVDGIVTKMSIVKPYLQTSVHYCQTNGQGHVYDYDDNFNLDHLAKKSLNENTLNSEQNNAIRTQDNNGNPLSAEYGFCMYRDYQEITIQEMPERAPTG